MNLHEECLIKYLINPLDLFYTTELLKENNNIIENGGINANILAKTAKIQYTANRR